MSIRGVYSGACLLLFLQTGAVAQESRAAQMPPGFPEAPGVYWKKDSGQWIKLERAALADTKNRGMGRFMETDGLSNLKTTIVFRGARAAVRLPEHMPTFLVRETGSAGNSLIVRLKQKKDTREAEVSTWEAGIRNQQGFKRGQVHQVITGEPARDCFTITPVSDLEDGEYLLVLGDLDGGFDFGIGPPQR